MKRSHAGRTWLSACVLGFGLLVLLAVLGAGTIAGPVSVETVTDLGLVQVKLPPGTHMLALPVQPATLDDVPGILDVSLVDLETVETWDPVAQDFRAFFPKRPDGPAGEMKLASRVMRVTVDHPVNLRIRGIASTDTLDVQLKGALNAGFFGLTNATPITAGALLEALERSEPFVRGRDVLFMWDFDTAAWQEVAKLDPAKTLPLGTVFRSTSSGTTTAGTGGSSSGSSSGTGGTASSGTGTSGTGTSGTGTTASSSGSGGTGTTPPPTTGPAFSAGLVQASVPADGNLNPLAKQTATDPDSIVTSNGTELKAAEFTAGTTFPAKAPTGWAYVEYKFKGEEGRPKFGLAKMRAPAALVRMTDLPAVVPALIYFKTGADGKTEPQMLELLGFAAVKIGGGSSVTEVRAAKKDSKRPNLPLWVDMSGNMFTSGLTDLAAYTGMNLEFDGTTGLPVGQSVVTLKDRVVSLKFNPTYTTSYTPTGITTPVTAAAPAIEMAHTVQSGAPCTMRWVDVTGNIGPWPVPNHLGPEFVMKVTSTTVKVRDFWLDPPGGVSADLTLGLKFPFTPKSMPAVFRTTDSKHVSAVDGIGVNKASIALVPELPLVGKLIPDLPIVGIGNDPAWAMRIYPGTPSLPAPYVELIAKKFFSIKLWAKKFIYSLHPANSDMFSVEFTPTITYKIEGDGFNIGIAPRITMRLKDFGETDVGFYEDLFVTVMPTASYRGDLDFNQFVPDKLENLFMDLKILFFPLYSLGRFVAEPFRSNVDDGKGGKTNTLNKSIKDSCALVSKFYKEQWNYDGGTLTAGIASVARIHDVGTKNGANRISVYGTFTTKKLRFKIADPNSTHPDAAVKAEQQKNIDLAITKSLTKPTVNFTNGQFAFSDPTENFDARAGIVYERFANPPVTFGIDVTHKRSLTTNFSRETMLRVFSEYQLPEQWGWAKDRAASGFWTLTNSASRAATDKPVLVTNRYEFRATNALSFSGKALDLGGDLADFQADLTDLRVYGSAAQREDGMIDRDFLFNLSLMMGSIPDAAKLTGTGVRAGVLDFSIRRSATKADPNIQVTKLSMGKLAEKGFLDKMLDGPSALEKIDPNLRTTRAMVDCTFAGIGNDRVRLESVTGAYVTSGPRMASVGMGFRTSDDVNVWGHADLTVAKTKAGWSGSGFVGNLKLTDVVSLNNASVFVKPPKSAATSFLQRLVVGAELGFDTNKGGSFTDAGIKTGINLDMEDKRANVFLDVGSEAFKDAGLPLKAGGLDGTVTFTGEGFKKPDWNLTANASFVPPWEETQVANVAINFQGSPIPRDEVGAEVVGLIPTIPIYEQGKIELKKVGLTYIRSNKSFNYSGTGTVTLPSFVALDFPPLLTIPKSVSATITGNSKAKFALVGGFDRPFKIGINEKLSLMLEAFRFQRGSPFALSAIAALQTGATSTPLNVSFDSTKSEFAFTPKDSAAKFEMTVGDAAMTVSNYAIKLSRPGGKGQIDISGDTSVSISGAGAVSGKVALTVDGKKDVSLAISGVKGASLNLGSDTGGFKITPEGISVKTTTDGSGKRTATTSAAITMEFPSDWPGLGGQKVTGILVKTAKGFEVSVLTSLDLGLAGLPIEVKIEKLTIKKEDKDMGAGGTAIVRFLRPLNTVLGENGDAPVELAADISAVKDAKSKETKLRFAVKLKNDLLNIPFDIGFAKGAIVCKNIFVSTGPSAEINLALGLTSPIKTTLTLTGGIKEQNFFFDISADPRLKSPDILSALISYDFSRIFYRQLWPGFMGVGATFALAVGNDFIYRMSVNIDEFIYILPSSLPPFGFPFFEELSISYKFRGFGGAIGFQLRAPKVPNLQWGLSFVKGLITGFKDDNWTPMRTFLRNEGGDAIKRIFPGPGIGNIGLGMPAQIRYVFPNLKEEKLFPSDSQNVIKLHILDGFHNITDLIDKNDMANALVGAFEFIGKVAKIFSDPKNVIELIPKDKRAGKLDYSFAGSAAIQGNYLVQETADIPASGTARGLPAFGLLAGLAQVLNDSTVAAKMADVIMLKKPLVKKTFTKTVENGPTYTAQITDTFIEMRQFVDKALEIRDKAAAEGELFSSPRALQRHLQHGTGLDGALKRVGKGLQTNRGLMEVTITGSSAPFSVKRKQKDIFAGSVALFRTTTAPCDEGVLAMYSHVEQNSTQLSAVVTASILPLGNAVADYRARLAQWQAQNTAFQKWQFKNDVRTAYFKQPEADRKPPVPEDPGPKPKNPGAPPEEASGKPIELGVVSKALLFDISGGQAAATVEQGTLIDWTVTHALRDDKIVRAQFNSLGTMKFTAPATEFTYMYKGSMIPDMRVGLQRMLSLRDAVFAGDAKPYVMGLTVWSMLFNEPSFKDTIDKVTSTGKRVDVAFKNTSLSMGLVLDDIGYYIGSPSSKKIGSLSGAADIEAFVIDGTALRAKPFQVSVSNGGSKDTKSVSDLTIFDGSADVFKKIGKASKADRAEASDFSKLASAGLNIKGEPLVVNALKLELSSGQVNLIVQPQNIAVTRKADGAQLFAITNENKSKLDKISSTGSPTDQTEYPTEPGTFRVNQAFRPDVKGQEAFASTDLTKPVTTLVDLHAKLGTNILFRNVAVSAPAAIQGTYAMLSPGVLQGTHSDFELVGDPVAGMSAFMSATPASVTAAANLAGTVSATIVHDNKDRALIFQRDNGQLKSTFTFNTGQVIQGGFFAGLHLRLAPAGIGFDADIQGEIQFNGTFRFEGDVQMLVLNRPWQRGRFLLNQDGLTVSGLLDMIIAKINAEAKFLRSGVSITGDVAVGTNGTGIFGKLTAGFPQDQAFQVDGALKVVNKTIATGKFRIANNGEITAGWSLNAGGASISASLTFKFQGTVSVAGQFTASVDTFVGTFSVSVGASLSANGDVSLRFTPILLKFNIATGSVSIDIDASFVKAFEDALAKAAEAIEDFFSGW